MSERRCATCRHWIPDDGDGGITPHGRCQAIGEDLFTRPYRLAVVSADPVAGCTLFTLPEFHCALWEEKP